MFLDESRSIYQTKPDMELLLDRASGRRRVKPRGRTAGVILALLMGLGVARADTSGLMDAFASTNWTFSLGSGSGGFTNANTELDLVGPTATPPGGSSFDGIRYNGPLGGGLAVGGTVEFHWEYANYGITVSPSGGEIDWTPPGGGSPMQALLGQEGVSGSGNFSTDLLAGTPFSLLLTTSFPPGVSGKLSATLIITDFQFHPDIPEPSTGALFGSVLLSLGAARWRRCRRRASGQR